MALTVLNPIVRLQEVEVGAPDEGGDFKLEMKYSLRDVYRTRLGASTFFTPDPATEDTINLLLADMNAQATAFLA